MGRVTCIGISGASYDYFPAVIAAPWNPLPGNYLFARQTGLGFAFLYFGECENFATRMPPRHERWLEAMFPYGATHIFAHVNHGGEAARQKEERDLIAAYNPPMNVQHRTAPSGLAAPGNTPLSALGALGRYGKQ